ncbi:hypothetical protein V6L76_08190 [Pannonibacter sp. Pt2]|uniref:Uncharacterized protein n=1 Tax=Pannonibacter anstelovis TaxID=3121537 RepID=A0ABU7ZLY6_9HYPH
MKAQQITAVQDKACCQKTGNRPLQPGSGQVACFKETGPCRRYSCEESGQCKMPLEKNQKTEAVWPVPPARLNRFDEAAAKVWGIRGQNGARQHETKKEEAGSGDRDKPGSQYQKNAGGKRSDGPCCEPEQGIEQQYISGENQHGMQHAKDGKARQAAAEPARERRTFLICSPELDLYPPTEDEGKKQEELCLQQQLHQKNCDPVDAICWQIQGGLHRECHERQIDRRNTEQSDSPYHVYCLIAFRLHWAMISIERLLNMY